MRRPSAALALPSDNPSDKINDLASYMEKYRNTIRLGGPANIEEFSTTQWVSVVESGMQYPF
jgi:hypothetical protein